MLDIASVSDAAEMRQGQGQRHERAEWRYLSVTEGAGIWFLAFDFSLHRLGHWSALGITIESTPCSVQIETDLTSKG
jgi:hypothetical protein